MQEYKFHSEVLTERDMLILEALHQRGALTISRIAEAIPNVSDSTISINVTKLWREKQMVSKKKNPQNQRTTIIKLTDKGTDVIEVLKTERAEQTKTCVSNGDTG